MLLLTRVPSVAPPPAAGRRSAREVFAGLAFIRRQPVFLAAITLDLFAVLLGGAVALLPIYAKDILERGPERARVAARGAEHRGPDDGPDHDADALRGGAPAWRCCAAVTGFGIAIIGFGLSRNVALSLVCLFLSGCSTRSASSSA